MNLEEHNKRDDKKVWLSADESDRLLNHCEDTQERIAVGLGVRSGLRSHEILDVAPSHLYDTAKDHVLRIYHGKGDKFRETPVPLELVGWIQTAQDYRDAPASDPILDITTTRSLQRMLKRVVDRIDSDDPGWDDLTMHDLRRTWATQLRSKDVDQEIVMEWGGWDSLKTFRDHYRGTSTPEAQRREREKVDWL